MRKILLALALSSAMPLASCAGLKTNLATVTTSQVTTLGAAIQTSTLVNQVVDVWVKTAHPAADQLATASSLTGAVHTELVALEKAQASGQSLAFTAFNQALQALQKYEAANMASAVAAVAASSATS